VSSEDRARFAVATPLRVVLKTIASWGLFALAVVSGGAEVIQGHTSIPAALFLLVFFAVIQRVIANAATRWLSAPGAYAPVEVTTEEGGVTLRSKEHRVFLSPEIVKRAYVQPRGSAAEVIMETATGRCDVFVRSLGHAREILAAVAQAPAQRPVTFSFSGGLRVTVGVDGVVVAWPILRRRRFVPHARIVRIESFAGVVELRLDDGSKYEIATGTDEEAIELRDALVERLQEARDAYRSSESSDTVLILERSGRSTNAWVRESKALTSAGAGQYRNAAPPPEVLWRIASDPTEEEEKRVGAALALRGVLDDEGRVRLRATAEAAASPRVRVALSASADEEDDEAVAAAIDGRKQARAVD
jgi:hypothetical protein